MVEDTFDRGPADATGRPLDHPIRHLAAPFGRSVRPTGLDRPVMAAHQRFTLTVFAKAIHEARLSLMITAGVDLASQPAHTAACLIEWSDQRANVGSLSVGIDDDAILRLITTADKLGIDAFLSDGRSPLPMRWAGTAWMVPGRSDTRTPIPRPSGFVVQIFGCGRPSVCLSRSLLPLTASRCRQCAPRHSLSRLAQRPPLDGTGAVVEVYPAAALRRWDLPSRQYKRKKNSETTGGTWSSAS